tara:strand:+ start:1176 stop:2297 length:1122 start_codon:yes stop_codon:yes gene_type:complete
MLKKLTERIFPFLIAITALAVSASAAFYSISGLSKLFAGAQWEVVVMASSLEVAKLVIASLLYQYRKTLPTLLKGYLITACTVLILITSMGIYGFLSSAYQETANKESNMSAKIELIETKRDNIKEQLVIYTEEKSSINEALAGLRKGLSNNTTTYKDRETGQILTRSSSTNRKSLEKQLDQTTIRQTAVNTKIDDLNTKIFDYESEIVEAKIGDGTSGELGPLKYLSGLTGAPMDKIINYLLLIIIFVFDPLAISLVIAANFAFEKLKPHTRENLYGETVEYSVPEDKEFETLYDIKKIITEVEEEIIETPKPTPPKDLNKVKDNESQIHHLEKQKNKIIKSDISSKKSSQALINLDSQIQKLRDEDNQITY